MKLYGSLTSPFVRACRIAAIELGLEGVIEFEPTLVRPTQPNMDYGKSINPLRRVPALETEDGDVIIDSRVIIDYLNERGSGNLIPREAVDRLRCLNRHAVCAGATEALVSAMYETRLRPEEKRWSAWSDDMVQKAKATLDWADERADDFADFDLGSIGLVCLIGYAGFRFPQFNWLEGRRRLTAFTERAALRPSVADTIPRE